MADLGCVGAQLTRRVPFRVSNGLNVALANHLLLVVMALL